MRKTSILIFSLPLVIGFGHNKAINNDLTESEKVVTGPTNIHWGTKHNTLKGVTITWYSSEPDDSIKWGYSREYESGKYPGKRSDYGSSFSSIAHFLQEEAIGMKLMNIDQPGGKHSMIMV